MIDKHSKEVPVFYAPESVTLTAGTSSDGVADIQTLNDGNWYDLAEVAATPGFDLRANFINIPLFKRVHVKCLYQGSSTHDSGIYLYNDTLAQFDRFDSCPNAPGTAPDGFCWHSISVPFPQVADYVSASNVVIVQFYHPSSGNAAHDQIIEYITIEA